MATQTTYNFRFQDTADGQLFNSKLRSEINDSPDVIIGCLTVNAEQDDDDDTIYVVMKDVLDQTQEDTLNSIVAAHHGAESIPPVDPAGKDNFLQHVGIPITGITPGGTTNSDTPINSPQWLQSLKMKVTGGQAGDRILVRIFDESNLIRALVANAYWSSDEEWMEFDFANSVPIDAGHTFRISYVAVGSGSNRTVNSLAKLWKSL